MVWNFILAAIGGGSALKAIEWAFDYAGLRKGAKAKFRDDLLGRVDGLQHRVDNLEEALQNEQRARVRAELKNEILNRRLDMLIQELNRLRKEQGMEPLDPEQFRVSELPIESVTDSSEPL
jgi:hypothetical protein